ncbi:DUF4198 domain-containing protein [Hymenobacter taeanensis]|uniref:DUF4198 domain-containing protein n=1 Tax=Hymenobacter taeanensis TaxID=2735321 RepID=A0A6M6BC37_9BACT|nr:MULTISPECIES: DUF4198 domain-containing protein [Hymenobacter]QJX45569.1 DUF4198 domain-containing protein [Hymenobacter taeanensis]UOQ81183.1 DUF4198 domain-containing protein [Hymenobacter sp. 5414T-23]
MRLPSCLLFAPLLLLAGAAAAQEFWLEPARFKIEPGTALHVRVFTGAHFQGKRWAGKASRITQLLHLSPTGLEDVTATATAADSLRTTLTFTQPGTHLVALTTNQAFLQLSAADFTTYLQESGLGHIIALRKQRGEAEKPGREAYQRCATTLVQVGTPLPQDTARAWGRPLGLPVEILPEQNPTLLKSGMSITLRILAAGRPMAGQLVQVWQRGNFAIRPPLKLRSNQNGRVLFRLQTPGEYLVSTVQMSAAPAHQQADWQSTWSTFTFAYSQKN